MEVKRQKQKIAPGIRHLLLISGILCVFIDPGVIEGREAVKKADPACVVCSRIEMFQQVHQFVSRRFWEEFEGESLRVPLVYFSDTTSYLAFSDTSLFDIKYDILRCGNGMKIFKYARRLDAVPFHMENKMDFTNKNSPYYYNPVMLCSNVEKAKEVAPVKHTEEWIQLVMHEYFHGFQFHHPKTIAYFADSVRLHTDSLNKLYLNETWFSDAIKNENKLLLDAAGHTGDSMLYYTNQFIQSRLERRKAFMQRYGYSIAAAEDFWEKTEGTARYLEYYTGYAFMDMKSTSNNSCDSLFNYFQDYETASIDTSRWFRERTEIMPAYYYVTGFNMCRLMDKLRVEYKNKLFENAGITLFGLLCERKKY